MAKQEYHFQCRSCKSEWHFIADDMNVGAGAVNESAVRANKGRGCPKCGKKEITLKSKKLKANASDTPITYD